MISEERELAIKQKASNQRTFILGLAMVAIVLGVVVPVWIDRGQRAQREEQIAHTQLLVKDLKGVIDRLDADDSPEAEAQFTFLVNNLIDVLSCKNRANLDNLLEELVNRKLISPGSKLACLDSPVFTYPSTVPSTVPSSTVPTTEGG